MKTNPLQHIHEKSPWQDMTTGGVVYGGANSPDVQTGQWRSVAPVFHPELCRQCLLCFPVCPDSAIPVSNGERLEFDYDHCKGCGICAAVCPFGAISYGEKEGVR